MHVVRSLTHVGSQPILHLRLLNPHVSSLLGDGEARPSCVARLAAASAGQAESGVTTAAGTSAFAYQGVRRNTFLAGTAEIF